MSQDSVTTNVKADLLGIRPERQTLPRPELQRPAAPAVVDDRSQDDTRETTTVPYSIRHEGPATSAKETGTYTQYVQMVARTEGLKPLIRHVFPKELEQARAYEFFRRPEVMRYIQEIIDRGQAILLPKYRVLLEARRLGDEQTIKAAYQDFMKDYADFYILCSPVTDPDTHPWLLEAEAKHGVKSIVRGVGPDQEPIQRLWSAGVPKHKDSGIYDPTTDKVIERDQNQRHRALMALPVRSGQELLPEEKLDLLNNHGPFGLTAHTFAAAELYFTLASLIQKKAETRSNPNDLLQAFKKDQLDVTQGAVSFGGHDSGRLITFDPRWHIIGSEAILAGIGLEPEDRVDCELSLEFGLHGDTPHVDPTNREDILKHAGNPNKLIWYLCDFYGKLTDREQLSPAERAKIRQESSSYAEYIQKTLRMKRRGDEQDLVQGKGKFEIQRDPALVARYTREAALVNSIFDILHDPDFGLDVTEAELAEILHAVEEFKMNFMQQHTQDYYLDQAAAYNLPTW